MCCDRPSCAAAQWLLNNTDPGVLHPASGASLCSPLGQVPKGVFSASHGLVSRRREKTRPGHPLRTPNPTTFKTVAAGDQDVAAVRDATDIAALIGEKVGLRRQGTRLVGLCPFHSENTPSFSVNAEAGLYYCFGCGASGDAITFVRQTEQLSFREALEYLASRSGVVLSARGDPRADNERRMHNRLAEIVAKAAQWYHELLLSSPAAADARAYLRSRGIDGDLAREFHLGWAPRGWDSLCRELSVPGDQLRKAGLANLNRSGRLYDSFRARIMFPIFDPAGRPIAFGGRALPPDVAQGQPKYVNSTETPLYSKRKTLYALNWAKGEIVKTGEIVVCEGYTDVLALFKAGVRRAVATCGTALGEDHVALMGNFARRVVLAFDADSAGQGAADRFYSWENRHELDIAVAALPPGTDPADLAVSDQAALVEAVSRARPYLSFRLERLMAASNLTTAEGRAKAASAAASIIREHPDALVRDQYVMAVSDRCRMDPARMRELVASRPREPKGETGDSSPAKGAARPELHREPLVVMEALRLSLGDPEVISRLDRCCFPPGPSRMAFEALAAAGGELQLALSHADPPARDLLHRLVVQAVEPDPDSAAKLIIAAVEGEIRRLLWLARTDPDKAEGVLADVGWAKGSLESLRESAGAREAERALVAWLMQRFEEDG